MNTELDLLFGVVAFQSGAVDADGLAETCAAWATEPTLPLADMMVDRGLMTVEQRTEVERAVAHELATHGGDPHATLAATMDGRSLEAIGEAAGSNQAARSQAGPPSTAARRARCARRTLAWRAREPRALHPDPPARQGRHGPRLAGPRRLHSAARSR